MADTKITALTALTAADPINDVIPIVDVSDTSMAASGTTKKISVNNILSSSPTASGALTVTGLVTAGSATITGAATVGTTLGVTGVLTFAAGPALLPALTTTGDTNTGIFYPAADTFAVSTGGVERYRVDSDGNLYVGKTTSSSASTGCELQKGTGGGAASVFTADAATASIMNRLTSDGTIIDFRRQTSSVGTIAVTTTATAYNTSSDYRLKEAAQPLVGGLARVNALKPSIYKWKADGSAGEGFIAHELADVVPFAVTGDKDAVDANGKPAYQGVDLSKLVPILVAAIQELTARVQTLEAR